MNVKRQFIDWRKPPLVEIAQRLLRERTRGKKANLQDVILVVPGAAQGQQLLIHLVDLAAGSQVDLIPPEIVTPGKLPELLYEEQKPLADRPTQLLAWIRAMRETPAEKIKAAIPELPLEEGIHGWLPLASMLMELHTSLAGDLLDFSDVAKRVHALAGSSEHARWVALAEIQTCYLSLLDKVELWDVQTARRVALQKQEYATEREIVLVNVVDMNHTLRHILRAVSRRVSTFVIAPEELSSRFDELGCLIDSTWRDARVEIPDEWIKVVDRPADQADAVLDILASFKGEFAPSTISIGVPDSQLVGLVRCRLADHDIPSRFGPGRPVASSAPARLLTALAGYSQDREFQEFAALLRHADVERWMVGQGCQGNLLALLDRHQTDSLPWLLHGEHVFRKKEQEPLATAHRLIEAKLQKIGSGEHSFSEISAFILDWLDAIYGNLPLDKRQPRDASILQSCLAIGEALSESAEIPGDLLPKMSLPDAIRFVLDMLQGTLLPEPPVAHAIELKGWLELPLDTSTVTIVTGFNDGIVPRTTDSDFFLPDKLRAELRIENNDRAYSRDAYALSLLAAGKKHLRLIVGRHTADEQRLLPSRLLFAVDREANVSRCDRLFDPDQVDDSPPRKGRMSPGIETFKYQPPLPVSLPRPVSRISVSSFRDYLACPYRFYLKHLLKLAPLEDRQREMSSATFGTLLHRVLQAFGNDESVSSLRDASRIEEYLASQLDAFAFRAFGKSRLAAVKIQIEHMRKRLQAFASWQAMWRTQGYEILHAEYDPGETGVPFLVDNAAIQLTGRIDRIDYHPQQRRLILLDYKTGSRSETPDKVHRKRGEWVDLQLPLYRHLIDSLDLKYAREIKLGYVQLSGKVTSGDQLEGIAEWTQQELIEADEVAKEVVRSIRQGVFWPPREQPNSYFREFAAICGEFLPTMEISDFDQGASGESEEEE